MSGDLLGTTSKRVCKKKCSHSMPEIRQDRNFFNYG